MIRFAFPLICLFLGFVPVCFVLAQEPAFPALMPAPVSLAPDAPGLGGVVEKPKIRDPFWPVGYVQKIVKKPPVVVKPVDVGSASAEGVLEARRVPQWDVARRKLDIRGISILGRDKGTGKPKYLAMVAGKFVEEGAVVSVVYDGRTYRWRLTAIGSNGVTFQKMDVKSE